MLYREELKMELEENLGYQAAGVFANPSIRVFNEYDPNNDKQFGMNWGDFRICSSELAELKSIIADGTAKHHVLIGSSHFNNLLNNDWNVYFERVENLIEWCFNHNIPIRT